MMKLNKIPNKIEHCARKFITNLDKSEALIPVIILEAAVTGGRTYQAYKRDGFIEARERATEETLGAVFWLGGVNAFSALGNVIGKKVLHLDNVDFEVGKDAVRNPVKNYMRTITGHGEKTLAVFKLTKIITSILLANAIIGFVVPKLNQAITRKYQSSAKNSDNKNYDLIKKGKNLDSFVNTPPGNQSTSFKGLEVQKLLSLANSLEADARYKLFSTDVGIVGGRAISARNKYERKEILFRDIASIYFYLFCRKHLSLALNYAQDRRFTRLDPLSAKRLDSYLRHNLVNKQYSADEFRQLVLGKNTPLPTYIQKRFSKEIKNNTVIKLEDFLEIAGEQTKAGKRAAAMSRLQPKLERNYVLTIEQIKDVYNDCLINNPRILKKIFEQHTNKASSNPLKFVSDKDLRNLKQRMIDYVEDIIKQSHGNITADTIQRACKTNLLKNGINLVSGFALSAFFLSTAIPKIQYWITKQQTGENKFPGTHTYNN